MEADHDPKALMTHQLYVCAENNEALKNHTIFREFLDEYNEYTNRLRELKWQLAEKYNNDRRLYVDGKVALYREITDKALEWRNDQRTIR